MTTEINSFAVSKVIEYLGGLDWPYVITVVTLAYFLSQDEILSKPPFNKLKWVVKIRPLLLAIPLAWRVLLLGIIYGIMQYWLLDYPGKDYVITMIQSLIFAMVAHKLLLEKWFNKLYSKLFSKKSHDRR